MSAPQPLHPFGGPLPRRDILAICVYLNRDAGPKAVDACIAGRDAGLDKLIAAARMQ